MKLQHGRLEVLPNAAVNRTPGIVQHGLGMVVAPRVRLGKAKGVHPTQPVEEVREPDIDALHRNVRHLVTPWTQDLARMWVGEARLHALVDRSAEPAAQVVPRQAALERVPSTLRRRLPIDDAALVVLRQRAAALLEDLRRREPPALDPAGPIEVRQEVGRIGGPVGEVARQVQDVVLQLGVVAHGRHLRRGRHAESQLARRGGSRCDRREQQGDGQAGESDQAQGSLLGVWESAATFPPGQLTQRTCGNARQLG